MVLAFATAGWTSTERTTHCMPQTRSCTSRVTLTCCCPTAPTPVDRIQLPRQAPPPTYVSTGTLMDDILPSTVPASHRSACTSQWSRDLDLRLLNRALLI
jgi:hypothetical protein